MKTREFIFINSYVIQFRDDPQRNLARMEVIGRLPTEENIWTHGSVILVDNSPTSYVEVFGKDGIFRKRMNEQEGSSEWVKIVEPPTKLPRSFTDPKERLRDEFATGVLIGMSQLSSQNLNSFGFREIDDPQQLKIFAESCYRMADAMLEAREK